MDLTSEWSVLEWATHCVVVQSESVVHAPNRVQSSSFPGIPMLMRRALMISLVLMSGSIFCHAVPVDAGLFTTYTNDNAKTTLYWIVCGSIPPGSGCFSFGQVGPFGEIGAARDQNLAIWQKSGGAEVAARVVLAAFVQVPLVGSYSSQEARPGEPPTASTVPVFSRTAVWPARAVLRLPVVDQLFDVGS